MILSRLRSVRLVIVLFLMIALCIVPAWGRSPRIPSGKTYTNSIGMKFVRIEPGTFQMGQIRKPLPVEVSVRGLDFLKEGDFDEEPVHSVTISRPFYMGIYEVTNFQYELFEPEHKSLRGKHGVSSEDDEAVINVSWYDAVSFCRWLTEKDGMPYRLATEAEWEYACRAGGETNYNMDDILPEEYRKRAHRAGGPMAVDLKVGQTPANGWGLFDMHGNVEEWCYDWYGPYKEVGQRDPIGYAGGSCRVTRGGSYGSRIYYLRSANRMSALPGTRNWVIGFRVVLGRMPDTEALAVEPERFQRNVEQENKGWEDKGPDMDRSYFKGPRKFVRIPTDMYGPVFASHNHNPGLVVCPNGDLLAAWFSTVTEGNREMVIAGSRLRRGEDHWDQASQFFDAADRNESSTRLWNDGKGKIYHLTSVSFAAASRCAVAVRTSEDNGVTWSGFRFILPEFTGGQGPSGSIFRMLDGSITYVSDYRGSTLWISRDEGLRWRKPLGNIAGIHGGAAQLKDGRVVAFGRGGEINGMMPKSVSTNLGETWDYSASDFPPIGGQQRLVLLKLEEGPLFFASFTDHGTEITDASGVRRTVRGLFAAVSEDGGRTWPYKRLVSDDGPGRAVESTAGGLFIMSQRNGEYRGYMSAVQSPTGVIHLVTSREHYEFNLEWLKEPSAAISYPPVPVKAVTETFTGSKFFDNEGWAAYHAYRGGFNGKGQYTINALGPLGGINRIVGKGSFDMRISIKNIRYNPSLRESKPGFALWLNDNRSRVTGVYVNSDNISVSFKDKVTGETVSTSQEEKVTYTEAPESIELRVLYSETRKQVRVFYGLDGDEADNELPASEKGMHYSQPLSETTTVFLLFSNGSMDVDRYEIEPIKE
ncbi:MAG TPA: SUMF1/EgtB/PvdO family nonheme iron enzyme [Planctomycetes bacterium]|nr:SUMF1/EgtB/PvdO family nonheme iron enzyme [Planctomycetota bacterium]